jgi:imidazolonepropionase-like amidohydrolase
MKTSLLATLALSFASALAAPSSAQDLTITNAHIVVGNGTVIDKGSIVVRGGKIVSVAAGTPSAKSGQTIDAKGMSAMAGFIDAHKHVNTGPDEKAQMQRLLEAGYTTVLSGGGPADGNITLRDHIEQGLINGPQIIPSGSLRLANHTPESAREEVRKMAALGIKYTGEIALTPVPGPSEKELETLRAVLDEAKKVGVLVQVHAVSSPAMMAAVNLGIPLLVHIPNKDWVSKEDAAKIAASGTKALMTIGFGAPVFGVVANDNKPRFRDGKDWPSGIVDGVRLGEEAGYMIVNARTLFDAGVILGYCTDTVYDAVAGLEHELKSMNVVFSTIDMIKIMGPNTASYIQMQDQLGTLEAGKLADVLVVDGDPVKDISILENRSRFIAVLQGGMIKAGQLA